MTTITTMTQLFKIISTNDYEKLEKIIVDKNKSNFNCIKSNKSLISKAIEVRAFECFNLLIQINDLSILQSNNNNINGLNIALDYYLSAPNLSNKYYLDKLIEHNVLIDCDSIIQCFNNTILFDFMFNKFNKKITDIKKLANFSVSTKNMYVLESLYYYLHNNNVSYYSTPESKYIFNNIILESAVKSKNILAIKYLETIGHDIMYFDIMYSNYASYGCITVPLLYYVCLLENDFDSNSIIFDFIFSRMEKMNVDSLNQIKNIKKISMHLYINFNKHYGLPKIINNSKLNKILLLPIDWDDLDSLIFYFYYNLYNIMQYYGNSPHKPFEKLYEKLDEILKTIYIILKSNNFKVNPYDKIILNKDKIDNNLNLALNKFNSNLHVINNLKSTTRKIKYIFNNFGFETPESINNHYKFDFNNDNSNSTYEIEKKKYIEEIETWYNNLNKVNKINKPKINVIKKKVPIINEFDL